MSLSMFAAAMVLLAGCIAVFGILGRLCACNDDQAVFASRPMALDLAYGAIGVLYAGIAPAGAAWLAQALPVEAGGWLGERPLLVQVALLLAATDFGQYWLHRALHRGRLWPFHAVHHGAEQVNWTTAFRVHPVNYLLYNTSLAILARLLGFSADAFLLAAPITFFSGAVSHANLNWTFGPLRYAVASPVFHRWHHTIGADTRDRNFAPMFPVWDLMFGTFHMPDGRRPAGYGAAGVPPGLLAQFWSPFQALIAGPGQRAGTALQPEA